MKGFTLAVVGACLREYKPTMKDALDFLTCVRRTFGKNNKKFNELLEIMKDFRNGRLEIPMVIDRVEELFRGYPYLIVYFNLFLPEGYHISVM